MTFLSNISRTVVLTIVYLYTRRYRCCPCSIWLIIHSFSGVARNFVFVFFFLMGWPLLSYALRPFKTYCAPPNLGIRTWICRLNFALAWCSLISLKSQNRDPQLEVPPGGMVLRIFTSWKNPSTSVGYEPASLGSRGEHVTPKPPRPTPYLISHTVN